MISPVKTTSVIPISIAKQQAYTAQKPIGNSSGITDIHNVLSTKKLHFVSYQKRSQEFYEPLVRFVDNLITQQSEISKTLDNKDTQDEINKIEKTSEKIVDFAKKLCGDDKSKIWPIKNAVKKGFAQAGEGTENFSEYAQKALESVMNKIDSWHENKE
ncbi:MAG: hypothetical protein ACM3KR_10625 [Deltaproteobacteria bacterium]